MKHIRCLLGLLLCFLCLTAVTAQQSFAQEKASTTFTVEPDSLVLMVGEKAKLSGKVVDAEGQVLSNKATFLSRARSALGVTRNGEVSAYQPGNYQILALAEGPSQQSKNIPVKITPAPVERVVFANTPQQIYSGTTLPVQLKIYDTVGNLREEVPVQIESSNPAVLTANKHRRLTAQKPGPFTLTATVDGITATWSGRVVKNPVARVTLEVSQSRAQTGDVIQLQATPQTADGTTVHDVPVTYSFVAQPDDNRGQGASAQIAQNGRFVANHPGLYRLIATSGSAVSEQTVRIEPRNVGAEIEVVGRGIVQDVHTSDLWVWEGVDGRDYAVTGTWGGRGEAYFWDVTNPSNIHPIDTVQIDARTVNDVKVSADGRLCVLTREGASNRRNGIVILDVTDPHKVKTVSTFDKGLTGGVHNAFIYKDHIYAVNNGRRYDIINIEDPKNPHRVARYELDTPGHAVHDVWVADGIAYSSNWDDGVIAVDVGNGLVGGSPDHPVKIGQYAYPSGWSHAAFPYQDKKTGKFYVVAGDEAFPNGLHTKDYPTIPAGWIHFIDFTNWDQPKEVARYQVPEAGSHNYWVQGDTLYVAYYNAGFRVVDISGDLMGNLYDQGREIAHFVPADPNGVVPNAAMTWGPQPHKGVIFLSDWNSGLWAVRLSSPPQK